MSVLDQNRRICGYCQQLQKTNPGEYCSAHQDPPAAAGRAPDVMKAVGEALEARYPWGYRSEDDEP